MKTYQLHFDKEIQFPQKCVCCLKETFSEDKLKFDLKLNSENENNVRKYEIPYCTLCLRHLQKIRNYEKTMQGFYGFTLLVTLGAIRGIIAVWSDVGAGAAILTLIIYSLVMVGIIKLIERLLKPKISNPENHVDLKVIPLDILYDGEKGNNNIIMKFGNETYADLFVKENNLVKSLEMNEKIILSDDTGRSTFDASIYRDKIKKVISKYVNKIHEKGFFFAPNIPEEQVEKANNKFKEKIKDEEILLLYTEFLKLFVITDTSIHIFNAGSLIHVKLTNLTKVETKKTRYLNVYINDYNVAEITDFLDKQDDFVKMLEEMVDSFK